MVDDDLGHGTQGLKDFLLTGLGYLGPLDQSHHAKRKVPFEDLLDHAEVANLKELKGQ
jgi:hypothetical protein